MKITKLIALLYTGFVLVSCGNNETVSQLSSDRVDPTKFTRFYDWCMQSVKDAQSQPRDKVLSGPQVHTINEVVSHVDPHDFQDCEWQSRMLSKQRDLILVQTVTNFQPIYPLRKFLRRITVGEPYHIPQSGWDQIALMRRPLVPTTGGSIFKCVSVDSKLEYFTCPRSFEATPGGMKIHCVGQFREDPAICLLNAPN